MFLKNFDFCDYLVLLSSYVNKTINPDMNQRRSWSDLLTHNISEFSRQLLQLEIWINAEDVFPDPAISAALHIFAHGLELPPKFFHNSADC